MWTKKIKGNIYIHENDKHLVKKYCEEIGNETYFIKGKRVNFRVTQISAQFFPFDRELSAEAIVKMVKKPTNKYYHIVSNSLIDTEEKVKRVLEMYDKAAQDGTNVHLVPELFILNQHKYFNQRGKHNGEYVFKVVKEKLMKKFLKREEQFDLDPFKKSVFQFVNVFNRITSDGWKPFNPEWKIWIRLNKKWLSAGTIDLPLWKRCPFNKNKIIICLGDWKHVEKLKKGTISKFPSFLYEDLEAGQRVYGKELQYSLQLNTYKYILENNYKNKEFQFDRVEMKIFCLHENLKDYKEYVPMNLTKSVNKMFELIKEDKFDECVNDYKSTWEEIKPFKWFEDIKNGVYKSKKPKSKKTGEKRKRGGGGGGGRGKGSKFFKNKKKKVSNIPTFSFF